MGLVLESVITCLHCGHKSREKMTFEACQNHYTCLSCHTVLEPTPGNCCVFCSYGSVKCPIIQRWEELEKGIDKVNSNNDV